MSRANCMKFTIYSDSSFSMFEFTKERPTSQSEIVGKSVKNYKDADNLETIDSRKREAFKYEKD